MQTFLTYTWRPIEEHLKNALIASINRDRSKEQVNRECIRSIIQSYKDMGLKKPTTVL